MKSDVKSATFRKVKGLPEKTKLAKKPTVKSKKRA